MNNKLTLNHPAVEAAHLLFESGPTFYAIVVKEDAGVVLTVKEQFQGAIAGIQTLTALSVLTVFALDAVLTALATPPPTNQVSLCIA